MPGRFLTVTRLLLLFLVAIALCSCDVSSRLVWSPDGQHVALTAADGLRVSDASGEHLTPPLNIGAFMLSWLSPDTLLAVCQKEYSTWASLEAELSELERQRVRETAGALESALRDNGTNFHQCESTLLKDTKFKPDCIAQALVFLRDQDLKLPDALAQEWRHYCVGPVWVTTAKTFEAQPERLVEKSTILRQTGRYDFAACSPDLKTFALVSDNALSAVSGGKLFRISNEAGKVSWEADGTAIVAVERSEGGGKLCRYPLIVANSQVTGVGAAEDICSLPTYDSENTVQCLRDGTALVAIEEGRQNALYIVRKSERRPTLLLRAASMAPTFSVSPDQKQVVISFESGKLMVITLRDGKRTNLNITADTTILPCWRNNSELCFASTAKSGEQSKRELVLYSLVDKKSRPISGSWPVEATTGLLSESKDSRGEPKSLKEFLDRLKFGESKKEQVDGVMKKLLDDIDL